MQEAKHNAYLKLLREKKFQVNMAATDTVKNLWNKSGSHPIRSLGLCLPFCRRAHETALTILIDITDHALASWTSYSDRCSGCSGKYRRTCGHGSKTSADVLVDTETSTDVSDDSRDKRL